MPTSSPTPVNGPARPTCSASGSRRSRRSRPRRARTPSWPRRRVGSATRRSCAPPPSRPAAALSADEGPDALGAVAAARRLLDGVRDHDAQAAGLADRLAELSYVLSDLAADVASYASGLEADPARLAAVSDRRAALVALTRKYGATVDEVLAWAETSAQRLDRARRHRRRDRPADRPGRRSSAPPSRRPAPPCPRSASTAAKTLGSHVTDELGALAMPHARVSVAVTQHDDAAGTHGRQAPAADDLDGARRRRAAAGGQRRRRPAGARQGRLRWRAVAGDAGARGRAGRHQSRAHAGVRRGRRGCRRQGCRRGGATAGDARQGRSGPRGHPPAPGRGLRRPARRGRPRPATAASPPRASRCSTTRAG